MMGSTELDREPNLRRIAVIGDVHCEDERLAAVLRHFAMLDVDGMIAVGDIVDGEGDANRACRLLAESGVLAVLGNHDRWFLEAASETLLAQLPTLLSIRTHLHGSKAFLGHDLFKRPQDASCCVMEWGKMT